MPLKYETWINFKSVTKKLIFIFGVFELSSKMWSFLIFYSLIFYFHYFFVVFIFFASPSEPAYLVSLSQLESIFHTIVRYMQFNAVIQKVW